MVNRAVVGILAAIVVVSFSVGLIVGYLAGSNAGGSGANATTATPPAEAATPLPETTATATQEATTTTTTQETTVTSAPTATATPTPTATATPTPTPTPTPTAAPTPTPTAAPTPTPTPTPTATPTATPEPTPTPIPSRRFNATEIGLEVERLVNERRADAGENEFQTSGTLADSVRAMAANHSIAMADAGEVAHTIEGTTTSDRYQDNNLYNTCGWTAEAGFFKDPEQRYAETIGQTVAGQTHMDDGEQKFHGNETAVAREIVEDWWADDTAREKLLQGNPTRIGVGVEIVRGGEVYVTANICG
jgi:uncharacterized protein YkwD